MSNIVHLFRDKKTPCSSDPESLTLIHVAKIMASIAPLAPAIGELSAHLDAIEGLIESLGDPDAQKSIMQTQKEIQESLILATRDLSLALKKMALGNDHRFGP